MAAGLDTSPTLVEHRRMADDSGPWSLSDFARHHAGADLARRVPGCLRYLKIYSESLDSKVVLRIEARVSRRGTALAEQRAQRDAELVHVADRLRAAAKRRADAIAAVLKRELTGGAYTITGSVAGQRLAVAVDDVAALDVRWTENALVGTGLRFDAVAVTRIVPVERAPRGSGGRPAEYDWEAFAVWLGATVYKEGFPPRKADFVRKALQWFANSQGREPAESVIRERLDRFYEACGFRRKP